MGVEIKDGAGRVRVSVTPPESLCDGEFHTVIGTCTFVQVPQWKVCDVLKFTRLHLSVSLQHGAIRITVDSVSEQKVSPLAPSSTTLETLHIGGKSDPRQLTKIDKHTLFSFKKLDLLFLLLSN